MYLYYIWIRSRIASYNWSKVNVKINFKVQMTENLYDYNKMTIYKCVRKKKKENWNIIVSDILLVQIKISNS